jgi:lysophospholipase L1-like esterase
MASPPTIVAASRQGVGTVNSVTAGGSGYVVGDTITLTGGTFTVAGILRVGSVSGGAVTAATIIRGGVYSVNPSNAVAQGSTSGVGTGATFNLTFNQRGASDISSRRASGITDATVQWNVVEPRATALGGDYNGSAAYSAVGAWVEFETDSQYVNTHFYPGNGGYMVFVNGERISAAQYVTTASTSPFLSLSFADATPRHIRIAGVGLGLTNLYVSNEAKVWKPTIPKPVDCFMLGDSYTHGTGASEGQGGTLGTIIGRTTGFRMLESGVGGAGYNTAAGTNAVITRVANDLLKRTIAPEVVIFALGYNDSAGSQTTIHDNALAAFRAVRSGLPAAWIVVLGPWTPLGTTANLTTTATTIANTVAEFADPNSVFIPIADLADSVNKSIYTDGDNVHPSQAGHVFLGARIGQLILQAIA